MIVVLSLNTALDRILLVPGFQMGRVHRADRSLVFAGGKALNVARVVRAFGLPVRVVGFLGGMPTAYIRRHCDEIGIEPRWVETQEDSRSCVILVDPDAGAETVVNEPGPVIPQTALDELWAVLSDSVKSGDTLAVSGSAPPGVPDAFYGDVVRDAQARGARVLIDASRGALLAALRASPWAATPNVEECAAALGQADSSTLVCRLAQHAEHAVLTLGSDGVLYAHGSRVEHMSAPRVRRANAVGSGDALVGGFLAGIELGMSTHDALRLGVICGASNAGRLGPGIGSPEDARHLLARLETGGRGPGEERLPAL